MAGHDPLPEIDEADAITIVRRFFIVFLEIFVDEVEGGRFATAPLTMEAMTYPLGTRRVRITLANLSANGAKPRRSSVHGFTFGRSSPTVYGSFSFIFPSVVAYLAECHDLAGVAP
jgi:hypothetical protein